LCSSIKSNYDPLIRKNGKSKLPSKRASDTSSLVTFKALSSIAMFCDFFGSNTLFSLSTEGRTDFLEGSFGAEFVALHPNNDSIMSSFNLLKEKRHTIDTKEH